MSCLKGRAADEGASWMGKGAVYAWQEKVLIPTYGTAAPDKNPMFLEKRVYQGSSGVVYPNAVVDRVNDTSEMKEWNAVFIENKWIKLMILPELGGRLQMAMDKTNGYQFIYYNEVIKPALVGLCGPWISGGLEFNWPQHHRPSTFEKQDYKIVKNHNGSVTVWCGEIEKMSRTKGIHGFTLFPDKSLVDIQVKLYNRSSESQTFLWWANPAVHVNDDYQSIFPPDVSAVMDHGKRAVSDFPIATGTYYKIDYSPGTDISRYKNIPVPTSFMAYHSDYNFIGCYDHGKNAGMIHVANHYLVPGKKQWTWGTADFGQAWDRHLTDENGPYIELMCGAFTDNQPDFSWLMPGEEKQFTQTFMPFQQIDGVKNASREAALNLVIEDGTAEIGVYLTSPSKVKVELINERTTDTQVLFSQFVKIEPDKAFKQVVKLKGTVKEQNLSLKVFKDGIELLSFSPVSKEVPPAPEAAKPPLAPAKIASNDLLYMTGLHLEQYRHATREAEDYYREAIRRDSGDSRCNNAIGLLLYRRGQFAEAEKFFSVAIKRLTMRNPNPYNGEAYYNLGLSCKMQQKWDEAYQAFYKACWNEEWKSAAYFELARIDIRKGDYDTALGHLDRAIARNEFHHKARHLKIAALRKMGKKKEAFRLAKNALQLDPMELGALYEIKQLGKKSHFERQIRLDINSFQEIALDYAHAGLFDEAYDLLNNFSQETRDPMNDYYTGWFSLMKGDVDAANKAFKAGETASSYLCFPNHLEAVAALNASISSNPAGAKAPYYLGLYYYSHKRALEAVDLWEKSAQLDSLFPTVHRNLALAYYNKMQNPQKALVSLEKAFSLDKTDARVYFELDQLYKKLKRSAEFRLDLMSQYQNLVALRDDQTIEMINLLNLTQQHEKALNVLLKRNFHPWEGGEGKVIAQYIQNLVALAREEMIEGDFESGLERLHSALSYPENLGEGKLPIAQDNNIYYFMGEILSREGKQSESIEAFTLAAKGSAEPASALYYNDQPPEMIFYQGLARRKLGKKDEATLIFNKLKGYGNEHLNDTIEMDFFAVSLPDFLVFDDDLSMRNRIHCLFMSGLGELGLGNKSEAIRYFKLALKLDPASSSIGFHLRLAEEGLF